MYNSFIHFDGWEKCIDTLTNEERHFEDYGMKEHAKYRANKLKVVDIFNRYDPSKKYETTCSIYKSTFCYKVGEIVEETRFNIDLEIVCTHGIHYFKTLEAAFYYQINVRMFDGLVIVRDDSGYIVKELNYVDGRRNGLQKEFYDGVKLKRIFTMVTGIPHGLCNDYWYNGEIRQQCNYFYGKIHGRCEEYNRFTEVYTISEWKDGRLVSKKDNIK